MPFIRTIMAGSFAIAVALAGAVPVRAADSEFPAPVVVVYPFTVSGNTTDPQAGGNVAVLLSTRLQSLGGLTVKPFTPGTQRAELLSAAVAQNADYYVTGFLTPIGSEVSLITQVVSTYGGTVVWSNTATIRTYADALGQADGLRDAILRHAGRALSAITSEGAASAATPEPHLSDAAALNLTRALGRHRRSDDPKPASPPPATPVTVAAAPHAAPVSGAMVASFGGAADPTLRAYASAALAAALHRAGVGGGTIAASASDAIANAAALCHANPGNATLYVGTLANERSTVTLDVTAYDCAGKSLGSEHATESQRHLTLQAAIDRAATSIVAAFAKRSG